MLNILTQATTQLLMVTTAVSTIPVTAHMTPKLVKDAVVEISKQNMPEPLPKAEERGWNITIPITAYSSTADQTDDSPFITANGTVVRDGVVAANFLPLGSRVKIPALFGDKEFVVADRMNKRYYYKMDIWMPSREQAQLFGLQYHEIEVLPPANKLTH